MLLFLRIAVALALAGSLSGQPATFQHRVSLGSTSYTVNFRQHTARGPNFQVWVQQADGSFRTHTPGAVRTYIGTIPSLPGAMASAVRRANGSIYYHVLFANGAEWIHNGGATSLRTDSNWTPKVSTELMGDGGAGSSVWAAEVGVDLPFSQYSVDGNAGAALEMVEHSVNTVNLLYLRDAGIIHRLGRVVVRANASRDPYAGASSAGDFLSRIVAQWERVLPASTDDVALVATRVIGGGVAYVGAIGTTYGYSANGGTREGDFSIVWRHEIGHNWSLRHFDGGAPEGRTINSGNALSRMSGPEQVKAVAHRRAKTGFLDHLGPYPIPIPPRASLDVQRFSPQTPIRIDVMRNDHDANGQALRLVGFAKTSSAGGTITRSPGTGPGGRDELLYTPPRSATAAADHFTYRIADTTGREAEGNVVTKVQIDADLLAHFTMDASAGTTALDSSEYRNDAVLEDGATRAAGTIGGGVAFGGADARVTTGDLDAVTPQFTVAGWVRRTGNQANAARIAYHEGSRSGLQFGRSNALSYAWGSRHGGWSSGLVVPDNRWTFVALVVSPTAATVFMDWGSGMQTATNFASHPALQLRGPLTLGHRSVSTMDDVRIYRRALSSAEIARLAARLGNAADPVPRHLAAQELSSSTLTWTSSPATTMHRIYFSRSYDDVRRGRAVADRGLTASSSWTTPVMGNRTWFWRVDSTDGTQWWPGPVWALTVTGGLRASAEPFGSGCGRPSSPVPRIGATGRPQVGSRAFAVELTNAAPNAAATFYLSLDPVVTPLGSCRLLLGTPLVLVAGIRTNGAGAGSLPLPIPSDFALVRARVFGQFVVQEAGGPLFGVASMSDGLHMALGF